MFASPIPATKLGPVSPRPGVVAVSMPRRPARLNGTPLSGGTWDFAKVSVDAPAVGRGTAARPGLPIGPEADAAEREADATAERILKGNGPAPRLTTGPAVLHRKCDECAM